MSSTMEPERVTYTEVYRTDCPHGCDEKARVTVIREKRGPVISIRVECMANKVRADASAPRAK